MPITRYTPPSVAFDPKSYPKRPGTPPSVTAPPRPAPQPESASAEADRIIAELLAELGLSRDSARRESELSAEQEIARARALSEALTQLGMPGLVQGAYSNAAGSIGNLARGFSSELSGLAGEQAGEMTNMLGGNAEGVRNEGQGMGDVLYGTGGFIPARGLEQSGAAFSSQAALQPGFALQFGQQAAGDVRRRFEQEVLPDFTDKEAQIRTQRPSIEAELKETKRLEDERKKDEAKDLYSAGLISQREFAKRMGLKDWRKFPNTLAGQGQQKVNTSLSKELGYLVDDFGNPILNKKGKPVPLTGDRETKVIDGYIWERDRNGRWVPVGGTGPGVETKTTGGYIWERDPKTGEWYVAGGTGPRQPSPDYQLKEFDDGSTGIFDGNTGSLYPLTGPKGKKGKPATVGQKKRAGQIARESAQGHIPDVIDGTANAAKEVVGRSYQESLDMMLAEGIPLPTARTALARYWKRGGKGIKITVKAGPYGVPVPYAHYEWEPVEEGRPLLTPKQIQELRKHAMGPQFPKGKPASGGLQGLAALWIQAGGDPSVATTAAAIALAESGGRVDAWNPRGKDKSAGLWQINYHGDLYEPRVRQFGTPELLRKDAMANAKAAVAIYKSAGNSFSPWTTYTSGAYRKHMDGDSQQSSSGGNNWGGSKPLATTIATRAQNFGLKVSSEKRDRKNTASGGVSDHWSGSKNAYAYDLSGSSAQMDRAAQHLLSLFRVQWNGKDAIVKNFRLGEFRVQILYRTNVGGNHFDHIHIGVRRDEEV